MLLVMHRSDVLGRGTRAENLAEFEPMLVSELIPEIKRYYRTPRAPARWAIAGLSLGGEFAMTVGLRHPELFRTAASISGSMVERDFDNRFGSALTRAAEIGKQFRLIWLACGDADIFHGGNNALAEKFKAAGISSTFREFKGAHIMPVFRRELVELLPLLFR